MPYSYPHLKDSFAIGKKALKSNDQLTFPGAMAYQTLPVFVSGRVFLYASMA